MSARSCLAAATLTLALPLVSASGGAADEPAGTRLRVVKKGGSQPVVGRLVQRAPDQLTLDTESGRGPVQIPYSQVASLQVSEGRNRSKGVWFGVLVGLVAAGGVYAATTDDCSEGGCAERFAWMAGSAAAAGALVGLAVAPERWRSVDRVPDVTSIDRSRRFRLALRPAPGGVAATAAFAF
ncbi:MAG TPA: hypothetical protein VFQ51_02225 [Vicinamibacteria bacterium]|nr:hypothetical protein [Vicinamibacteria bacterium]